jgi:hypothetical protein
MAMSSPLNSNMLLRVGMQTVHTVPLQQSCG